MTQREAHQRVAELIDELEKMGWYEAAEACRTVLKECIHNALTIALMTERAQIGKEH